MNEWIIINYNRVRLDVPVSAWSFNDLVWYTLQKICNRHSRWMHMTMMTKLRPILHQELFQCRNRNTYNLMTIFPHTTFVHLHKCIIVYIITFNMNLLNIWQNSFNKLTLHVDKVFGCSESTTFEKLLLKTIYLYLWQVRWWLFWFLIDFHSQL